MSRLDKWVAAVAISVVVICAQVITTQYGTITQLREKLETASIAHQIEMAQIDDLQYQLETLRNRSEYEQTRGFVSGVLEATQRRDYYSEIWHAGYSRGTAVQQYADQLEQQAEKNASYTAPAAGK